MAEVQHHDPRIAAARQRWRSAGDRLWPIAMSDGVAYREAVGAVGVLVDELRRRTRSLEDLLLLDADPGRFLDDAGADAARAAARPEIRAAACAVRAEELAAVEAWVRRARRIADARAAGETWVVVDESPTRVVEMHLASGRAVVATADPYLGAEPFRVGELALDPDTGDPVTGEPPAGPDAVEGGCATPGEWAAQRERRRADIDARLDSPHADGSDR